LIDNYRVNMKNINKSFGGVRALKDVDLKIKKGEIHALVGENGAGKSTLMKILSGAYQKDKGTIKIDGKKVSINNPHQGRKIGVGIIYQEFALAPDLTVAENIYMSNLTNDKKLIKWSELYRKADDLIAELGFNISSRSKVGDLSVAYQQVVEITKALSEEAKILILDEPTAVLAPQEAERLFGILNKLKEKGVSIIYISHRLDEIFKIADNITVMRDGNVTGVVSPEDISMDGIIQLMIGRELTDMFPKRECEIGKEIFKIENLSNDKVNKITFSVKEGEVLGFAGLVGSGRSEVMRSIFGADSKKTGKIFLEDEIIEIDNPKDAVKAGIGLVPESRKEDGIILSMPIKKNVTMANLKKVTNSFGIIKSKKEKNIVNDLVKKLAVKTNGINSNVSDLSGGNQQKVVLAKWFNADIKVIILDEPTRGVDVGAKVEIYNLINELAKKGVAIIVILSELMEIMGICDRTAVMNQGTLNGFLDKEKFSEENIMKMAIGGIN